MNQNNEQLEQDFSIAELLRMVKNTVRFGTIEKLDEKVRMKVRVKTGDIITNWIPWIVRRAGPDREFWCPEPKEQVVILSPGGDMAQGVVLPALYSNKFPANADDRDIHRVDYKDGSWVEHDRKTGDFKLYSTGSVMLNCEKDAVINVGRNADVQIGGWGQIVAQKDLLIKSKTRLTLKGPSNTIVL